MTTYTKATNFASKDSMVSGNPLKTLKGTELDDEFNLLAIASATKANITSPTFTGVPAAPTATTGTDTTQVATTAFVEAAVTAAGIGSYLSKSGGAMTGAITTNSTFDGVDIATRDAILTSTTTLAGAALSKSGGAMTGAITTNSTFDGRNVATDGTKLDTLVIGTSIQAYDATILVDADIGTSVLAPTGDGSSLTGVFPTQTSNAGKFLTTDGSAASWAASATGGSLLRITRFTTAGSGTWTKPADTVSVLIRTIAGGGGGSGASSGTGQAASGGCAGGYAELYIATAAASYVYVVGAGGAGGALGQDGGSGSATSIAGIAGGAGNAGEYQGFAAATTPTGGDINVAGSGGTGGGFSANSMLAGGCGGTSQMGGGGGGLGYQAQTITGGVGVFGSGGGGGGFQSNGSSGAAVGGAGGSGYIEIQEYS